MKCILSLSLIATLMISSICLADWVSDGLEALKRDDVQNAIEHFKNGAKNNDSRSMYQLLILLGQDRLDPTFFTPEIVAQYKASADWGDPLGQNNLGFMYEFAIGVTADKIEADRLYKSRGKPGMCLAAAENLGLSYLRGIGVRANSDEAFKWLTVAATHGFVHANFELGWILYNRGDYKRSLNDSGSSNSEFHSSNGYLGCDVPNTGVTQDFQTGFNWLLSAWKLGTRGQQINRSNL